MRPILSIAATTFRESIRNRTVLAILVLAAGFIASSLLLAELALDQRVRVLKDWGLFCVAAFGVGLAILMGVNQVHKEVRRKTLYAVLSRPIPRWKYVLGKYAGTALTLLVEVGALAAGLVLLLLLEGAAPDILLLKALLLSLAEILLVAALAVFFASFSSPYLSGFFTLGTFLVGRSVTVLVDLVERIDQASVHAVLKGLVLALPDLVDFNLSTQAVHGIDTPWATVGITALYGLAYATGLLFCSMWIFSRRNLT
ncbi:MAG: ABC transporter permease subunit [Deltaproteobacteria bacterium]|nr:ABC transporter permease subunit [Deltaproteobacteria bacterium]